MYPVKFMTLINYRTNKQTELNAAFNDITPDLLLTVYGQSERKMELKLNDHLNCKIKIPTDEELETYVNDKWNRGQFEYDNVRPKAIINYIFRSYIAYDPMILRHLG